MLLAKAVTVVMNSIWQGFLVNGLELVTQDFRPKSRFVFCSYERCEIISSAVCFYMHSEHSTEMDPTREKCLSGVDVTTRTMPITNLISVSFALTEQPLTLWTVPLKTWVKAYRSAKFVLKDKWLLCFWLWFYSLTTTGETVFSVLLANHG